jgi:GAF domain-containing protein
MKTHGHYLVPIVLSGKTLGLIFLYSYPYPVKDTSRLNLLQQVSDLLAASLIKEPKHPLA